MEGNDENPINPELRKDVLGMMKKKLKKHKRNMQIKTKQEIDQRLQEAIDDAAEIGRRRRAESDARARAAAANPYKMTGGKSRKRKRRRNKRKTRKAKRTVRRRKSRKSKKSRRRRRRR